MKTGALKAFIVSLALTTGVYTAILFGALEGLGSETLSQNLLLIFLVSFAISLGITLSYQLSNEPAADTGMSTELAEGGSHLLKALSLLVSRPFLPLLFVLALMVIGLCLLGGRISILGGVLVFAAQIIWLGVRKRLNQYAESGQVPAAAETPLWWIFRAMDCVVVLATLLIAESLSTYAKVVNTNLALLLTIIAAFAGAARWHNLKRMPMDLTFVVKTLLLCIWVAPLILVLNFGLDFRAPTKRIVVTFRGCPDKNNPSFTNANVQIPKDINHEIFEGCSYFNNVQSPAMEDKVETLHHPGALAISWVTTLPLK